mgnify:CR=1 FL=1
MSWSWKIKSWGKWTTVLREVPAIRSLCPDTTHWLPETSSLLTSSRRIKRSLQKRGKFWKRRWEGWNSRAHQTPVIRVNRLQSSSGIRTHFKTSSSSTNLSNSSWEKSWKRRVNKCWNWWRVCSIRLAKRWLYRSTKLPPAVTRDPK